MHIKFPMLVKCNKKQQQTAKCYFIHGKIPR